MKNKKRIWIIISVFLLVLIVFPMNSYAKEEEKKVENITEEMADLLKSMEDSEIKRLLDFAKEQVAKGNWETKEGIDRAIQEGEEEFNISLKEEEKEKIHNIVNKIKELKIAPEFILEQAEKIYKKYGKELTDNAKKAGEEILEETKEKIQEEIKKSVKDYFSDMVGKVRTFLKGFFIKQNGSN